MDADNELLLMDLSARAAPVRLCIDIGCGAKKRAGFIGLDIASAPGVDHVVDFERERLPFADDSVDYVFSNHAFEHIRSPQNVLREIVRVCRHDATVEIWTPYLKSNDAFLLGHDTFYNEGIWKHICFEYDDFYFGDAPGRFDWLETRFTLAPAIVDKLARNGIDFEFALEHMFNIAVEFGVFIRVDKNVRQARKPQIPQVRAAYSRSARQWSLEELRRMTAGER